MLYFIAPYNEHFSRNINNQHVLIHKKPEITKINQVNEDFPVSMRESENSKNYGHVSNNSRIINANLFGVPSQSNESNQLPHGINELGLILNQEINQISSNNQNIELNQASAPDSVVVAPEEILPDFKKMVLWIMINTIMGQIFLILLMVYFIWNSNCLHIIIYLIFIDFCELLSNWGSKNNSK